MAQRNGTGMFPREVMNRFPLLPLEEEGRLNDLPLRENFIERVFGLRRKAWLSAWQFAAGKLHDRMDPYARQRTHPRWPGPCLGLMTPEWNEGCWNTNVPDSAGC